MRCRHSYFPAQTNRNRLRSALAAHLLLYIFALPAFSSLILSAPDMDASTEGTCLLNFTCSEDASALSAQVELPSGFEYAGHERLLMDGTASPCPPRKGTGLSSGISAMP